MSFKLLARGSHVILTASTSRLRRPFLLNRKLHKDFVHFVSPWQCAGSYWDDSHFPVHCRPGFLVTLVPSQSRRAASHFESRESEAIVDGGGQLKPSLHPDRVLRSTKS